MVLLVIGYNFFFAPDPELEEPTTTEQSVTTDTSDSIETEAPVVANEPSEPDSLRMQRIAMENASRWGIFAAAADGTEEVYTLENDVVKLEVSNHGAWFKSATLNDGYQSFWEKENIQLFDPERTQFDLWFDYTGKGKVNLSELYFTKQSARSNENGSELTLRLNTSDPGKYLEFVYQLAPNAYNAKVSVNAVGLDQTLNLEEGRLDWTAAGLHLEKGISWERQHSSVFYRENGRGRDYLGESREDDDEIEKKLNWVAFKQNYFSAAIIDREGLGEGAFLRSYPPTDDTDTTTNMFYEARLPLAMNASSNTSKQLEFYFGPNDLDIMDDLEVEEFGKVIDYGWWIFGWVNRYLIRPLFDFLYSFIGNMGITIIVITILIKLALSPVTWKNFVSSAKMRVLRPEMEEINEKYKDDAMGKQQAQMALYKETGVNPFAGCLPMLLQLPILYAMFRFFPANIDMRGKSFLWAEDLGAFDAIFSWTTHIPVISSVYGNHISGFTLMMAVSTFFYSRMNTANMPQQQQPGMPNMKVIMNLFPIITLVFFNRFAAGLNFYYFCSNLISIIQMVVIKNYLIDEDKIHAKIQANKANPKKKKKSGFQQRLEEAQKLQQERAKQKKKK